eukprot:s3073_g4.t3
MIPRGDLCSQDVMWLALEVLDGGSLRTILEGRRFVCRVALEIGSALQYIHSEGLLHRDVKPANILLTLTAPPVLKLADFGISKLLEDAGAAHSIVGTQCYFSPELISGEPYASAADCWAFGVVLFELASLSRPFSGGSMLELAMAICQQPAPPLPHLAQDLTEVINGFRLSSQGQWLLYHIRDPSEVGCRWQLEDALNLIAATQDASTARLADGEDCSISLSSEGFLTELELAPQDAGPGPPAVAFELVRGCGVNARVDLGSLTWDSCSMAAFSENHWFHRLVLQPSVFVIRFCSHIFTCYTGINRQPRARRSGPSCAHGLAGGPSLRRLRMSGTRHKSQLLSRHQVVFRPALSRGPRCTRRFRWRAGMCKACPVKLRASRHGSDRLCQAAAAVPFLSLSPSEAMRAIPGQRLPALRALQEAREFAEKPELVLAGRLSPDCLYSKPGGSQLRASSAASLSTTASLGSGTGTGRSLSFSRSALRLPPLPQPEEDESKVRRRRKKAQKSPKAASRIPSRGHFEWCREELLGRGAMASVWKARCRHTGKVMAVKEVNLEIEDGKSRVPEILEREVSLHARLSHSNIVAFLGTELLADKMHIFLEYMSGGSLYHLLQIKGLLQEVEIAGYARQVLQGLHYLHTRKPTVLHRDLKTANILLGPDGVVKLADFGCAKRVSGTAMHTLRGSVQWMAPEVLNQQPYGKTADIWSFGCVLVEMITGKAPWGHFETSVAAMIHVATAQEMPPLPEQVDGELRDLVKACTSISPRERPSARKLLANCWIASTSLPSAEGPSLLA